MAFLLILLYVAIVAFYIYCAWMIYTKARKPGWAVLIPIYNTIVLLEIVGKPLWWIVIILFVPILNVIFFIWAVNLLSLSFGKSSLFTLGLIFIPFICLPVLGLGKAKYKGPAGK